MAPKPKGGIAVMIGVGKPRGAPPPYRKREEEKPPEPAAAAPEPKTESMQNVSRETAPPSPRESAGEGYGEKLFADMKKPLMDAGLNDADAKDMLAQIFESAAACLRRGGAAEGEGQPTAVEGEGTL